MQMRRHEICLNLHQSRSQRTRNPRYGQSQGGQIIFEYVLLLAITVAIAVLMTKTLIGRDDGNTGFVLSAWQQVINRIGSDFADDVKAAQK